jgi:ArsR family metal-binding transcriptional regulator
MVKLVNRIWSLRERIEPSDQRRQPLQAMRIYLLLPRSNCKQCGQATCFNFALQLASGQAGVRDCPGLLEGRHEEQKRTLEAMVASTEWL